MKLKGGCGGDMEEMWTEGVVFECEVLFGSG
jgi:hypothetical protein